MRRQSMKSSGAKTRLQTSMYIAHRATAAALAMVLFSPFLFPNCLRGATPLTTLEYKIVGTQLRVDPPSFSVPKGVPGSIQVNVVSGDGVKNAETVVGAPIEATLRGPSFPARRLVGRANEALLLPPLNLVGDYQIDDIKLVDSTTGAVRLEGT